MTTKTARKKIVKVYPRELLRIKGMSPKKFDELREYSADRRRQIIAEAMLEQQTDSL